MSSVRMRQKESISCPRGLWFACAVALSSWGSIVEASTGRNLQDDGNPALVFGLLGAGGLIILAGIFFQVKLTRDLKRRPAPAKLPVPRMGEGPPPPSGPPPPMGPPPPDSGGGLMAVPEASTRLNLPPPPSDSIPMASSRMNLPPPPSGMGSGGVDFRVPEMSVGYNAPPAPQPTPSMNMGGGGMSYGLNSGGGMSYGLNNSGGGNNFGFDDGLNGEGPIVQKSRNMYQSASQSMRNMKNGLPRGWKSTVDSTTGDTYYYNKSLGIVQWDYPLE